MLDKFKTILPVVQTDGNQVVNARDLHAALQVQTQFNHWIERKIQSCGLQESLDFWSNLSKSTGGRPGVEYQITLDAAKHMAMTEHTEIGKQVRQYFIEVEKLARSAYELYQRPKSYSEALRMWADEIDKRELVESKNRELAEKIAEDAPKVGYYDTVINSKDLLPITIIAKDLGMSAQELNAVLSNLDVQYRVADSWVLYSKYQGLGYTKTKDITYPTPDGEVHVKTHTYWTQKGREFIVNLLKEQKIND